MWNGDIKCNDEVCFCHSSDITRRRIIDPCGSHWVPNQSKMEANAMKEHWNQSTLMGDIMHLTILKGNGYDRLSCCINQVFWQALIHISHNLFCSGKFPDLWSNQSWPTVSPMTSRLLSQHLSSSHVAPDETLHPSRHYLSGYRSPRNVSDSWRGEGIRTSETQSHPQQLSRSNAHPLSVCFYSPTLHQRPAWFRMHKSLLKQKY